MYKHLLIISDGESVENSLHLTDRARAQRLLELLKADEIGDGTLSAEAEEAMREADEEAAGADYPEGVRSSRPQPEDYVDALCDLLSSNDFDCYFNELALPTTPNATLEVSTT